jgi:hypothetical protein
VLGFLTEKVNPTSIASRSLRIAARPVETTISCSQPFVTPTYREQGLFFFLLPSEIFNISRNFDFNPSNLESGFLAYLGQELNILLSLQDIVCVPVNLKTLVRYKSLGAPTCVLQLFAFQLGCCGLPSACSRS